jgi:hypothetical protein
MTEMTGNLVLKDFLCHRKAHRYNKKRIVSYITEPILLICGGSARIVRTVSTNGAGGKHK